MNVIAKWIGIIKKNMEVKLHGFGFYAFVSHETWYNENYREFAR